MPDSWAKALAPTMALFGCTGKPVMLDTRRDVLRMCSVTIPVSTWNTSWRVRKAMTISSSAALPARSPRPLMVHSTWRAPAVTAASELATASPRSLWQCTEKRSEEHTSELQSRENLVCRLLLEKKKKNTKKKEATRRRLSQR